MKMTSMKGGARARLLTSTLLAGLATVAAPMAIVAVATAIPTLASAQDYSSGSLVGTVKDSAGVTVSDATITVKSLDQGFTRTTTTDSTGQFRVPLIPIGGYSVSITKEGYQPTSDGNVRVGLGGSTAYTFNLTEVGGSVSEIVITATANPQLDFAATTKGLTVDLETLTKQVPIARSITAVTMLAPSVTLGGSSGDANFAGQPAVGGSSIAENAFYVNGLNITNFNTYVGGATVPFDFYKTVEVKTGGYPAEFGRATGGVVNAVTKSGGNDFHFALHGNYEPSGARETSPDSFQEQFTRRSEERKSLVAEVSGPIIEDHLFFYLMNQQSSSRVQRYTVTTTQTFTDRQNDPFWGGKLDAYITDRQHLELTYFDTTRTTNRTAFNYNPTTRVVGAASPGTIFELGGKNWVGKYTGTFTDWFTLSAAYGVSEDRDSTLPENANESQVNDLRGGTTNLVSRQKTAAFESQNTKREFYRVDGDLYFKLLGDHHVRMGYDNEETTLFHISSRTGGRQYIYRRGSATDTRGVAAGQDYVQLQIVTLGGATVTGENESIYLQDAWDITPNLSLQLGIRDDIFKLNNLSGERVLNLKDNFGPRIGFTWDPRGEGKDKVYGSYGRYFIPPASNLSFRGKDLGFSEFFLAPAGGFVLNPVTGMPASLGQQITTNLVIPGVVNGALYDSRSSVAACPTQGLGTAGVNGCTITFGIGTQEPTYSKTSKELEATHEDEFIIGYQRQFNELWKGNVSLTYRKLEKVSEDTAIDRQIVNYCDANGIAGCDAIWFGDYQYIVYNPGEDVTIKTRDPLPGQTAPATLHFTAAEIGQPKPKREYIGLEMSFERAFDGKWGLQGSYVLSQSKGNYEGTVLSDVGQDDAGSTQLYDHTGLADYQYGLLPNHHAHQFKVFGSYAITDNLMIGANASAIAPKHFGCLGVHPTDPDAAGYGASSRYCQGKVTPRGSQFKTDWQNTVDLSLRYTVPGKIVPVGSLVLRADVFNVFNSDSVSEAWEFGDTSSGAVDPNYKKPVAYQTPRYMRFGFDLEF